MDETALWWARVRAAGPTKVQPGSRAPRGMARLIEPDASAVWLLPELPEGARPDVLDELGLPAPISDRPNETARVLAVCVRCCWADPAGPLWPGAPAPLEHAAAVFRAITLREDELSDSALTGAVRRLAASGWLLWHPATRTIRLGPRTALWNPLQLSTLRELWRSLPDPQALTVSDSPPDAQ